MRLDVASPNQTICSQRVNETGCGKSEPNNTQSKSECDWTWQVWTKQYAVKEWMRLDVASLNQTIRSRRVNATGRGKSEPNNTQSKSECDWTWQVWTKQYAVEEWMRLDVASLNQTIRSRRVNATGRGKSEPNNTQSKSECDWTWQVWTKQYAVEEWMRLDVASLTGRGKSEPNNTQSKSECDWTWQVWTKELTDMNGQPLQQARFLCTAFSWSESQMRRLCLRPCGWGSSSN